MAPFRANFNFFPYNPSRPFLIYDVSQNICLPFNQCRRYGGGRAPRLDLPKLHKTLEYERFYVF